MGSDECSPRKHVYDISKSKRTRRATLYLTPVEDQDDSAVTAAACSRGSDQTTNGKDQTHQISEEEEQKNDHVKLNQLINVEHKAADPKSDEKDEGRALLGQYFADEKQKQLQLVVKQPEDGPQGVKLKRVFKRYVKALGQMVKSKRNQRLDTRSPALRLPM